MRTFRWLSASPIPVAIDLRRCGWTLVDDRSVSARIGLAEFASIAAGEWLKLLNPPPPWRRRSILLAGVEDAGERARLVRLGFGEVLGQPESIGEFEARAERLAEQSTWLPDRRTVGPLLLDLLARDCLVKGRPLGLHPREFALLWRLADRPGTRVSKRELLADVWQLNFVPETNSLAVHVFRLREKLGQAGLPDVVRTMPEGGYMLVVGSSPGYPSQEPARTLTGLSAQQNEDYRQDV